MLYFPELPSKYFRLLFCFSIKYPYSSIGILALATTQLLIDICMLPRSLNYVIHHKYIHLFIHNFGLGWPWPQPFYNLSFDVGIYSSNHSIDRYDTHPTNVTNQCICIMNCGQANSIYVYKVMHLKSHLYPCTMVHYQLISCSPTHMSHSLYLINQVYLTLL